MPAYEIAILVMVLAVLGLGSVIGLYVLARAYFGGRSTFRALPPRR